jgi:TRAP-type mannitol/chloroaromatic compound transport system substrate-binding protein
MNLLIVWAKIRMKENLIKSQLWDTFLRKIKNTRRTSQSCTNYRLYANKTRESENRTILLENAMKLSKEITKMKDNISGALSKMLGNLAKKSRKWKKIYQEPYSVSLGCKCHISWRKIKQMACYSEQSMWKVAKDNTRYIEIYYSTFHLHLY